jgi:hypothetical protein
MGLAGAALVAGYEVGGGVGFGLFGFEFLDDGGVSFPSYRRDSP